MRPAPALLLVLAACYDSRWGQTKAAQQHNAQAYAPAALHASDDEAPPARARHFRVRVVANEHHAAQTMEWQRQARDLVDDANRVLEPSIGVHLDVEAMGAWGTPSDEDLDVALAALTKDEPATDMDLVVGLVGSLPRTTSSFHEVGRARVLGKHVVLRAAPPLGEHDAIEKSFDELSDDDRARFRRERKRHRAVAVFLHEIGHTLGAPHEHDRTTLMNPAYDPKMASYSDSATDLMRVALEGRAEPGALAATLADHIRAGRWSPADRDEALAQLDKLRPPPAPPPAPPPPTPKDDLAGVSNDDRAVYGRAVALLYGGSAGPAMQLARPLFEKYPDVYVIQDLRCQGAIFQRRDAKVVESECAPARRLAR